MRAVVVERLGRKANCRGERRLWERLNCRRMVWMCFSRSLLMIDRREMGRKLLGELEGEVLGIGTTEEIFQSRGTRLRVSERLKIKQRE